MAWVGSTGRLQWWEEDCVQVCLPAWWSIQQTPGNKSQLPNFFLSSYRLELLLFVKDQFSWISWATLTHRFSSSRTGINMNVKWPNLAAPVNQLNFGYSWTFAHHKLIWFHSNLRTCIFHEYFLYDKYVILNNVYDMNSQYFSVDLIWWLLCEGEAV